jgi:predicted SnoaL-like aldol condensation-catalyzing enzyme
MTQMEINKKIVMEFYDQVVNRRDFEAASRYLGPYYIQHNPDAVDGAEGLKTFMYMMREKFPHCACEVKRVFADGDYVILHVHIIREPGTRGSVNMDIFRLEHSKVVEHWDVNQLIPEKMVNPHGML